MELVIKKIMNIMGDKDGAALTINFFRDGEIVFNIYDSEMPIVINKSTREVYLNCEFVDNQIKADVLNELYQIMKLLEDNIDTILECL